MAGCLANEIVPWEIEEIPDQDILFYRIPRVWFPDGILNTAAFRNTQPSDGMSTDWNKYSTARETRRRSQRHPPEEYAVVQLVAGEVRRMPDQTVVHSPKADNRAHTATSSSDSSADGVLYPLAGRLAAKSLFLLAHAPQILF